MQPALETNYSKAIGITNNLDSSYLAKNSHTPARLEDMFAGEIVLIPVPRDLKASIIAVLSEFGITKRNILELEQVARFNDFNSRAFRVVFNDFNGEQRAVCLSQKTNWRWTTEQIPGLALALHEFSSFLNANSVPTPTFITTASGQVSYRDSSNQAQGNQAQGTPSQWVLSYWCDALRHPADPKVAEVKAIGRTLGDLHRASRIFERTRPLSELVKLKGNPKLGIGYNSLIESDEIGKIERLSAKSSLNTSPAIKLLGLAVEAAKECLTKRDELLRVKSELDPCFIHCDPNPNNWLIVNGYFGEPSAVLLDLETVGYGSLYIDLGCIYGDIARRVISEGDSRKTPRLNSFFREFLAAYSEQHTYPSHQHTAAYMLNHFLNNFNIAAQRFLQSQQECPKDPNYWQHMLGVFDGLRICKELEF
jgi:Ser/Thr protein kinase RdoA (MazF antagonist)